MASWQNLEEELDKWQLAGKQATFWWRDDDACVLTPQLRKLVEIAENADVTVHLAVIPAKLEDDTVTFLNSSQNVLILQHGFSHTDYAPKGQGSWELGDHRPLKEIQTELVKGQIVLQKAFAEKYLPVLVPPWTRIGQNLLPVLSKTGYRAVSLEEGVLINSYVDVKVINTHCDPIRWKKNAQFKGTERVLEDFVEHLEKRRKGLRDIREPTGLCTHHMDHTEDLWGFLEDLLAKTKNHTSARWTTLEAELI